MSTTPAINQHWPEQGGIYIGSRLINGQAHHIVIPGGTEHDAQNIKFADVESCIPAEINGHSDWRAPGQEDLMLAFINAREHFDTDDWYWSRSEHHGWAWAVGFEDGSTDCFNRYYEFRVRPVRSFPASAI
jgi:hypothetical protein